MVLGLNAKLGKAVCRNRIRSAVCFSFFSVNKLKCRICPLPGGNKNRNMCTINRILCKAPPKGLPCFCNRKNKDNLIKNKERHEKDFIYGIDDAGGNMIAECGTARNVSIKKTILDEMALPTRRRNRDMGVSQLCHGHVTAVPS